MLHAPVAVNETGRPDDAVAFGVKSRAPMRLFAIAGKVTVWLCSSAGHVAGALPNAEQLAPSVFGVSAQADAGRLVASRSAAPASRSPQPMSGVQSDDWRLADCLRMSATW